MPVYKLKITQPDRAGYENFVTHAFWQGIDEADVLRRARRGNKDCQIEIVHTQTNIAADAHSPTRPA